MPFEETESSTNAIALLKKRLSGFETEEGRLLGLSYTPKSSDEVLITTTPKAGMSIPTGCGLNGIAVDGCISISNSIFEQNQLQLTLSLSCSVYKILQEQLGYNRSVTY